MVILFTEKSNLRYFDTTIHILKLDIRYINLKIQRKMLGMLYVEEKKTGEKKASSNYFFDFNNFLFI